jgi:integrase
MATVFKRGKNWSAQWYRRDGSRVAKTTGTDKKREAERIAATLEAADRKIEAKKDKHAASYEQILKEAATAAQEGRLSGLKAEEYMLRIRRVANPNLKIPTLHETIDNWQRDMDKRVKASTSQGYKDMVKAVKAATKDCPLPDFSHEDAKKLLHKLKDKRTAATANMHFRAFRRALQSAVQAQTITFNPANGVPPLPETDSTERLPFTMGEIQAMIADHRTSGEWRGAILIAAHTGLRLGDVVRLASNHVHDSRIILRPAKTERSRKTLTVPLTAQVKAWIAGKDGPFFPSLSAAKKGALSTQFRRIMDNAGITQPTTEHKTTKTFHSLRHTFTSWLANAEVPQDVRQKLTGHSDAGIHALYSHHDEALDKAIGKLPNLQISHDHAKSTGPPLVA